jgi:hypothetical protein
MVKKPTIAETVRIHILCWFGQVQRMQENGINKKVLYVNFDTTRLRGRPRNKWKDGERKNSGWRRVAGRSI